VVAVDDGDATISVPLLLLLLLIMMMLMTPYVLPQSLLLGTPVLKPNLDHTHVKPGLGAEPLAHVSCRLAVAVVGSLQRVQLMAADCRPRPLAAISDHPTAVVGV